MLALAGVILGVIIIAMLVTIFYTGSEGNFSERARTEELARDWEIEAGDLKGIVDLPVYVDISGDEEVILRRKLPSPIPSYSAVVGRNYHMTISISVDGSQIYKYPNGKQRFSNIIVADDWNLAEIPVTFAGRELEIRLKPDSLGFKGYIRPYYFGEDNALIQYIRGTYGLQFAMGISIIVAGLLMFAINMVYRRFFRNNRQAIIGLMLMITGLWLTNRSKMPLRAMGSSLVFFACFTCLLMVPTAIMIYYRLRFQRRNDKITKILMIVSFIMAIVLFVASLLTSYSIDRIVPIAYLLVAIPMIYIEITLWKRSYGKESRNRGKDDLFEDRFEFWFTLAMFVGFFFETIFYRDELWTEVNIWNRIAFNIYAYGHVIATLIDGYQGIKAKDVIEGQLHDSQMELLMGQIQPHYIFNTLSSIRTLTKIDPNKAYDMIYDFSKYLRANVDNMGKLEGINFAEEVEHIKSYVNIEQIRYGDRLKVAYDIQASDFKVPALSIQPLVENAIKHGVGVKPEGGAIVLRSYRDGNYNVVQVEDDGVGFTLDGYKRAFCSGVNSQYVLSNDTGMTQEDISREIIGNTVIKNEFGAVQDLSGLIEEARATSMDNQGSAIHKSKGMRNIIIRLKEMSNALIQVESQEHKGTIVTVKFPIDENEQ